MEQKGHIFGKKKEINTNTVKKAQNQKQDFKNLAPFRRYLLQDECCFSLTGRVISHPLRPNNQTLLPYFSAKLNQNQTVKKIRNHFSSKEILFRTVIHCQKMAISQLPPSNEGKQSPYCASSSNKRKASELKQPLSQKMSMGSQHNHPTKKEKLDDIDKPLICFKKVSPPVSNSWGCPKREISAIDRAHEVQERLPPEFPSFVKLMLKSHVTGGFWLGLPRQFCVLHLPTSDVPVFLVDESENEHETKYLAEKNGLSAGWRGFSIAHSLLEGDVLVFQLIKPCKFKVYIIRMNGLAEIDGAIGLLNLDLPAKSTAANATIKGEPKNAKNVKLGYQVPVHMIIPQEDYDSEEGRIVESCNDEDVLSDHSAQLSGGDLSPEVLDGIRFSETVLEFKDVKGLEAFSILVDGLVIDSEIPMHLRSKYFQLCSSRNAFLHSNLFKGLNCKLVAGVIAETVNISDAIRAAKLTTPLDHLQVWDATLKSFEDMGMAVGFLRERIKKLLSFQSEEQEKIRSKKKERALLEEEMRNLKTKLENVKSVIQNIDEEIKILQVQNGRHELSFKEMASAPW
ncbi:OLC1v1003010C1 [Oldenlandia corymbosa var. corymbosa]|uniref:OLC1v1003010C1 n=1 Tax=Oldenlandia corymbosa var. corymbosa TaxID=529605 RepID=A0AAV1DBE6_OLDCO|nr:OLC1v1003010C1 [Oldenlandia corymbosa var. corymbosa]